MVVLNVVGTTVATPDGEPGVRSNMKKEFRNNGRGVVKAMLDFDCECLATAAERVLGLDVWICCLRSKGRAVGVHPELRAGW